MDANDALVRLLEVSDDVRAAVVFDVGGEPLASTVLEDEGELASLGERLLASARDLRDSAEVRQLEAVTPEGAVYVVSDGKRAVLATAGSGALVGLVQHDLRTVLRELARPRRKARAGAAT